MNSTESATHGPMNSVLARALLLIVSAVLAAAGCVAATAAPAGASAELMKAIVYRDYGPLEVLRLEAIEKPLPKDNEVLVRVRAASVNPLDWHYMRGLPYFLRLVDSGLLRPKVTRLGVDFAGEVEAVGSGVSEFKPGDAVFGYRFGAFAEYVVVAEKALVVKPANISFEQAAAVPIAAVSALQGLRDKGQLKAGQKVLINGASGGVGTFAVQIAKAFGAEVTGVCSTRNADRVRSLGADHVIDYTAEDFTKNGQRYDLILDMVGSHSLSEYLAALTPQGALVQVGSKDIGNWLGPVVSTIEPLLLSPFVSQRMEGILAQLNKADLNVLRELMQAGKVTPVIDRTYPLSEAAAAIGYVEEGHARGKVVIIMAEDDPAPVSPAASEGIGQTILPVLGIVAFMACFVGLPIIAAVILDGHFRQRHPGNKPYRWGYYFSIQSLACGVAIALMLESGVTAAIICAAIYAVPAWFFAARRRWAWVALTLLSLNPVVWVINCVYLWKRRDESAVNMI